MNKKIAIVTHGNLATGFESALKVLIGNQTGIELAAIPAYLEDDQSWQDSLKDFLGTIDEENLNIVFTDIYGGSVNQNTFIEYNEKPITIITGTNLPILMEILLTPFETVAEFTRGLAAIVENSRNQLKITKVEETEDDFFD
ncbi:PTS sugar transporter subunit IIA [Enterococcus sp. LJL120]